MTIEQQNHFDRSQQVERDSIKDIFVKFLQYKKCSNLILTGTRNYEEVDCYFISAATKTITAEFKRREISVAKFQTAIIEFEKFKNLYSWHKAGNIALYIIEYNDAVLIWNTSDLFFKTEGVFYDSGVIFLHNYFIPVFATKNMADYQHGQQKKLFRNLQFKDALFILDKNHNEKNYNYILDLFNNDKQQRQNNAAN